LLKFLGKKAKKKEKKNKTKKKNKSKREIRGGNTMHDKLRLSCRENQNHGGRI
jgi:hypothetical protein